MLGTAGGTPGSNDRAAVSASRKVGQNHLPRPTTQMTADTVVTRHPCLLRSAPIRVTAPPRPPNARLPMSLEVGTRHRTISGPAYDLDRIKPRSAVTMKMEKLMRRQSVRRALASLGAVAAMLGANVVSAQPAAAWPSSSTVYVKGTAGCDNKGGIQAVHAEGDLDGKRFTWDGSGNWNGNWPTYQIAFTNVRSGRVPSGGGWAWITVKCSMGGYHQGWVEMYRPGWGDTINKSF